MVTIILDALFLGGLLAGAAGVGRIIMLTVGLADLPYLEKVLFALGCGLTSITYFTVLLAVVGGLYPGAAYAFYVLCLVALIIQIRRPARHNLPALLPLEKFLVAFLLLFAVVYLLAVLSPPTDWDGLMYHFEAPKRYIAAHGYLYIPNGHTNFPQFTESLYGFAMLLSDDILARLVNFAFGLLATSAIYVLSRRFVGRTPALLACLIFLSSRLVGYIVTDTFVEGAQAFYVLLALMAMLSWLDTGRRRWLWLSAAFTGVTLGIKLSSILLLAVLLWALLDRTMRIEKRGLGEVVRLVVTSITIALAFPLPWLIKNALFIGDPIFPALSELLGRWGRGMAQANWGLYGSGYGLVDYLLLPWRIASRPEAFGSPITAPVLLILTPLLIGLPRTSRAVRWLAGVLLVWFVYWANNAGQSVRFLLPGLAVYGVVLIVCADHLLPKRVWIQTLLIIFIVGSAVYNLVLIAPFSAVGTAYRSQSFVEGQSRSDFLTENLDLYPVASYVNQKLAPGAKVATVWEERSYYFDRPLIIGESPEGAFMHRFALGDDPAALVRALLSRGITHLIINANIQGWEEFRLRDRYMYNIDSGQLLVYSDQFRACCLRPVFIHDKITLYEVLSRRGPSSAVPDS